MTIQQKKEIAQLKSEARDIEELNRIVRAFDLGRNVDNNGIWIIAAKIDKLYSEIIDKKYGK